MLRAKSTRFKGLVFIQRELREHRKLTGLEFEIDMENTGECLGGL